MTIAFSAPATAVSGSGSQRHCSVKLWLDLEFKMRPLPNRCSTILPDAEKCWHSCYRDGSVHRSMWPLARAYRSSWFILLIFKLMKAPQRHLNIPPTEIISLHLVDLRLPNGKAQVQGRPCRSSIR